MIVSPADTVVGIAETALSIVNSGAGKMGTIAPLTASGDGGIGPGGSPMAVAVLETMPASISA